VTRKAIKIWQRALTKERGATVASAILRVLSVVLSFALDEDLIKTHPAHKLRLKRGGGNEEPWRRDEIAAFCTKASERGRPSIRLAALLMAGLGQRQGDVLKLSRSRYDAVAGTFDIVQNKRGRRVLIPVVPELREAIEAMPVASPTLVISEETGRPYKSTDFRYQFRRIADAAGLPRSRKSMTLRHTMASMLGEAGCTESEVVSILGNLPEIARKHYIRPSSAMAERAIGRLTAARTKRLTDD
jgi:integrase